MAIERVQRQDAGLAGLAAGPVQQHAPLRVVADEAPGTEGAAVDVAGEVAQGGLALADVAHVGDPLLPRAEELLVGGCHLRVDVGVALLDGGLEAQLEAGGEGLPRGRGTRAWRAA